MSEEKKRQDGAVHIDIKTVRRNERSIRVMKRLIAFLIVLFLGIGIYLSYPYWLPKMEGLFDKPFSAKNNSGAAADGNFPISTEESNVDLFTIRSKLVAADSHCLTVYDENGKKLDSFDHDFSSPVIRNAGKRALVFDFGSNGFKLFGRNGEIYSKKAEGDIMTAALGEDGTAAVLVGSNKYASSVLYYNKEGNLIYRYDSAKKVMSAYVTPDGKSSYICTFSSDNGEIFSQVVRVDLGEDGEQMVSEEIECLGIGCVLGSDGNINVVGDSGIFVLSADGKLITSCGYDGDLVDFSLDEDCTAVILTGCENNSGKLVIAEAGAADGEVFRTVACDKSVKKVKVTDSRAIVLAGSGVVSYSFSGSEAGYAALEKEYYEFAYLNSALYLSGKHGIDKIDFEM